MQPSPNRVNTASPFPTPSSSPGAMSLPAESDWSSTNSEWSLPSAHSSRAPSPSRPASRVGFEPPRLTPEQLQYIGSFFLKELVEGRYTPVSALPPFPAEASTSRPSTPAAPPTGKKAARIPRPANAFMLYRSWLIKTGQIPKDIESRQQNISRVAGECWNLLSKEEKAVWHEKARKIREEHNMRNPGYKFSPERKSKARKDPSDGETPRQDSQEYIRYIREKYVRITGAAVAPPRPRKCRSRRTANSQPPAAGPQPGFAAPPPPFYPPPLGPEVPRVASAPPTLPMHPAMHTPAFGAGPSSAPDYSYLVHPSYSECFTHYLTQAAQEAQQGDVVMPKVEAPATPFSDSALPTQPKFTFPAPAASACPRGPEPSPEVDLGLASPYAAAAPQDGDLSRPQTPSKWDHLETFLNVPDMLGPSGTPLSDVLSHEDPNAVYHLDAPLDVDMDKWFP